MPPRAPREAARVFDAWAQAGRDEGMEERHSASAIEVLEAMAIEPGERMLDLGTGNGWAAQHAAARGAFAVGVDVAQTMLARARRREGPRIHPVRASFEALCFPDEIFHHAFSMEALYYADDLDGALAEAHRVLVPGARLTALVDYYEGNPASRGWPEQTGLTMHRLSDEGWARAFERAGFEDVGTDRLKAEDAEGWRAEHGSLMVTGRRG